MFRLHTAPHATMLHLLQQVLAARNIQTQLRGAHAGMTAGEVPFTETWAELWFVDGNESEARRIVHEFIHGDADPGPAWVCARCGESSEGVFELCWNCGAARAT